MEKEKIEGYLGCTQYFIRLFCALIIVGASVKCIIAQNFLLLLKVFIATILFFLTMNLFLGVVRKRLYAKKE